jgi:hypothetical protein
MSDEEAVPGYLLTTASPKARKCIPFGCLPAIMYLAPGNRAGPNVCPFASPGCLAACLNTAGRGGIGLDEQGLNRIQRARMERTWFLHGDRVGFWAMLERDMKRHLRRCKRLGLRPAIRLNGTADMAWEKIPALVGGRWHENVMRAWPDVTFYDYTKWPPARRGERATGKLPENYSLTFSLSETNEARALAALKAGWNVAVVFAVPKGGALPATFWFDDDGVRVPVPVIDGDEHDMRFADPSGVVVGLRAKGEAIGEDTGFVREVVIPREERAPWTRRSRSGSSRRRWPRRSAGRRIGSSLSRCDLSGGRSASRSSRAGRSSSRCRTT